MFAHRRASARVNVSAVLRVRLSQSESLRDLQLTGPEKMAASGKYDAVIAVGAVIRGSTTHYDYVCAEVSKGIAQASMKNGVPVMFGVITTENIEQAIERAGSKAGNKGYDCALGAIEMVNLIKQL